MHHTIKITCSDDGKFDYEPHQVRLQLRLHEKYGDTVEWVCNEEKFALNFGWNTPFKKGRYQGSRTESIKPKYHHNVRHDRYKYFVCVLKDGHLWTDDPNVIIEP